MTPEQELQQRRESEQKTRAEHWHRTINRIGRRYGYCTLDNFEVYADGQREILAKVGEFISDIGAGYRECKSLVLFGPPGTGKDHLMVAALRAAVEQGARVRWVNGMDFFASLRRAANFDADESEEGIVDDMRYPHILAISDPLPPVGALTPAQAAALFRVIDGRYRNLRPTWITVNIADSNEGRERMGAGVIDRLKQGALALHCNWPSYRCRTSTDKPESSP